MDKKRKNENDEISQLLDSFQTNEEDTLEQKMDQFTKNQTRSRVEKHKPEPEIPFQAKKEEPSLGDTFVVGSKDLNEPKEDLSATRTVMWNADDLKQEADSTNQTVVIDDDEIQSLLEEGKGPQLKREVINKKKEPSKKKSAPKKSHSKTGMYVALGVVGVLLVSLLIFGGMKLMTGGLSSSDEKTSEVQKKNYQELLDFADKAKEKAYAPYSRFQVGAAILTKEGKVFTGCNVENSSYGAAICAERTAAVKAVSEGYHDFEMIAIASNGSDKETVYPCGICRQFLHEFNPNLKVICQSPDGFETYRLSELMPKGF